MREEQAMLRPRRMIYISPPPWDGKNGITRCAPLVGIVRSIGQLPQSLDGMTLEVPKGQRVWRSSRGSRNCRFASQACYPTNCPAAQLPGPQVMTDAKCVPACALRHNNYVALRGKFKTRSSSERWWFCYDRRQLTQDSGTGEINFNRITRPV